MTFFYDLNKKLDSIREKPEVTHGQLNERDMGKHNNGKTTGFKAVADKAAKEYGSKAAGERVAGAVKAKMAKAGKLEEEGMSRAAKGYEKYGKEGMQALAKAGREGKALDPIRNKYDKYDNEVEEGMIGTAIEKIKPMAKKVMNVIAPDDETLIKNLQKKVGVPQTGIPPKKQKPAPLPYGYEGSPQQKADWDKFTGRGDYEESAEMTPKQKKFAALAEPKDKITFADKIAGAKKEVDEMLGDVAAEAMKAALSGGQKKLDKNDNGRLDANDFAMLRKGGKGKQETDEGWDDMMKDAERRRNTRKVGDVTHGAKHDVEEIPGGRRVTRRTDPNTGYSVGADDDTPADGEKRGRGRPKGSKKAMGAKGPSGKSKLMSKEADHDEDPNVAKAKAILKRAGYTVSKDGEEDLEEKAVSKKQQRFMGMVHATQKGEKAPSKEVAKVAKSMGKKDAEDFASTKHKGLPEKKKPEGKKKEKTEEAGGTGTPTASSGFGFGKGIYDSINHELESMIAEGMNVNMSMNSDANGGPSKSLTVTATDDDALKLGKLLKMAGLGDGSESGYGGSGYQSACGCGTPDCSCGDQEMDEAYGDTQPTLNEPDYPTNTETAEDNFEYAGGLNKPKSTGQSTVPVLASQDERQESYAEAEEDALHRMMEMAGQPASGMGAQVGDMIDYMSPAGEQPPEDLIMQSGVQYDPDTNVISVPNSTQMANTHRAIEAAGWKKQTSGARPNPMAGRQAQVAGDVPYQLGEEDELARMMEMAGVKKKEVDEEKTDEGNKLTAGLADDDIKIGEKIPGTNVIKKKDIDEGILASTANLWKEYKGQYGV